MRSLRAPLVLTLLLVACAHRAPGHVIPPPGTARTPEDTDRLLGERVNAGDLDGLVALYEGGATLIRTDGTPATGHDAIRAELAGILAAKPKITMNVKTVRRGGDNVAVLYNDWHGTVTHEEGEVEAVRGCAVEVVRRQPDARWLFVVDDPDGRACGRRGAPQRHRTGATKTP
jgi:uncharacterized protein (TIGR02246 family)